MSPTSLLLGLFLITLLNAGIFDQSGTPPYFSFCPFKYTVTLQNVNGYYLSYCFKCGPAASDQQVTFHLNDKQSPFVQWTVEDAGNGKVAFKGYNGKYLSRCNNCWYNTDKPDAAFLHEANKNNPWAQWTPVKVGDRFAFRADSGQYLALCSGCVRDGPANAAFIHLSDPSIQWTQFKVKWDVTFDI